MDGRIILSNPMISSRLRFLVFITLITLSLAACTSNQGRPSPTPSLLPTRTVAPSPIRTLSPTSTATLPTATHTRLPATATPTLPVPTATLSPSPTQTLVPTPKGFGRLRYDPHDLVLALAWSPDGKTLAVSAGQNIHLVDALTLSDVRLLPVGAWAVSLDFSPDGSLLALAAKDGSVQVWNAGTGQLRCRLDAHHPAGKSVDFSPDGRLLASTGGDAYVRLWDVSAIPQEGACKLSPAAEMIGGVFSVPAAVFSPDGTVIASIDGQMILLREVSTQRLVRTLHSDAPIFSLAYSPDGSLLASGEMGDLIHLWDVASGEVRWTLDWPEAINRTGPPGEFIGSVAFNPGGNLLAAGSSDAVVTLWGVPGGEFLLSLTRQKLAVPCVAFSPSGERLAFGSLDATVFIEPLDLP